MEGVSSRIRKRVEELRIREMYWGVGMRPSDRLREIEEIICEYLMEEFPDLPQHEMDRKLKEVLSAVFPDIYDLILS